MKFIFQKKFCMLNYIREFLNCVSIFYINFLLKCFFAWHFTDKDANELIFFL